MSSLLDEKLLGQWARARLAHEAVMLEDAQAVLRQARAGVRGHQSASVAPSSPLPEAEGESMIHIGDLVQHHHAPPPSGLGQLAKAAIGAGLLATGLGIPAGAWMIADALRKPAEVKTQIEKQVERWDSTVEMRVDP